MQLISRQEMAPHGDNYTRIMLFTALSTVWCTSRHIFCLFSIKYTIFYNRTGNQAGPVEVKFSLLQSKMFTKEYHLSPSHVMKLVAVT